MLHERTVPLVDHDAVAVRDESDTLVLYAARLSTSQRAGLRLYLLEVLEQQEGPVATVAVEAGATERVLAAARAATPAVAPLGLTAAVLVTLAAALVAAAVVATVVGLIVEVQLPDDGNSVRPPRPVEAGDNRPAAPPPLTSVAAVAGQPPVTRRDEPAPTGGRAGVADPVDVLGTVRRVAPISESLAASAAVSDAPLTSTSGVAETDGVTPVPADPAGGGGLVELPEVRLPHVELPTVDLPGDLPDVDLQDASPDGSEVGDVSEPGEESEGSGDEEGEDTGDVGAVEPDPGESDE